MLPNEAKCSNEQYNSIYVAIDKTRKDSKLVNKIPKQALLNLLDDHAKLWETNNA